MIMSLKSREHWIEELYHHRKVVTEYIIKGMLPLSTVESPAFKRLIDQISLRPVQLPNWKTLSLHLEHACESMIKKIRSWRSFYYSRCQDITPEKLSGYACPIFEKTAVACFCVIGHQFSDILAAKIEGVNRNFGLQGKISATVTDNGSNFVKAFLCRRLELKSMRNIQLQMNQMMLT